MTTRQQVLQTSNPHCGGTGSVPGPRIAPSPAIMRIGSPDIDSPVRATLRNEEGPPMTLPPLGCTDKKLASIASFLRLGSFFASSFFAGSAFFAASPPACFRGHFARHRRGCRRCCCLGSSATLPAHLRGLWITQPPPRISAINSRVARTLRNF
jgi:hypothetical protein